MKYEKNVDVTVGLSYGDCSKGALAYTLLADKSMPDYQFVCRTSGGPNAGHTLYHKNKQIITHHIPCGVFFDKISLIGSGCVIHPKSLLDEIKELEEHGFHVQDNLKIAYNAHIITQKHIKEDKEKDKVGSTGRGIMPCYRDKYARIGKRAEDVSMLQPFLCDPVELLRGATDILTEGAQGHGLCPDHGDYPWVTPSSPSTSFSLHSLGMPPQVL